MDKIQRTGIPSPRAGFSLSELLIVITLLALLSTAAYAGVGKVQEGSLDRKVEADLALIASALEKHRRQERSYPALIPGQEGLSPRLCFGEDGSYRHDCLDASFMQGFITKELLGDSLQEVPLDPRTNTPYVYGITTDRQHFQIAGLLMAGETRARVRGGYWGEVRSDGGSEGSLIRAFDGGDFITNEGALLPYSPDPLSFTATLRRVKGDVTVQGEPVSDGHRPELGQTIEVGQNGSATLYLPDGSIIYLDPGSSIKLDAGSQLTKDQANIPQARTGLRLEKGRIWNKVARLTGVGDFRVETVSAIAGVRGTEFGMTAGKEELILRSGTVAAQMKEVPGWQNQDLPLSPLLWNTPLNQDKEASVMEDSEDNYVRFQIPGSNEIMGQGEMIEDEALIKDMNDRYYREPFNARTRPVIRGINAKDEGQDLLVFQLIGGTQKIHATHKDNPDTILHTWQEGDIAFDWEAMTMTVDPSPAYNLGSVKFRFEDMEGNLSPAPNPAVGLKKGMKLSQSQLYSGIGMVKEAPEKEQENNNPPISLLMVTVTADMNRMAAGTQKQMTATAKYSDNSTSNVTQDCQWSSDGQWGVMSEDGLFTANVQADGVESVTCAYTEGDEQEEGSLEVQVLSKIKAACYGPNLLDDNTQGDDKGYFKLGACWILADTNQSCDQACSSKIQSTCRDQTNPGGFNWNDQDNGNEVCVALTGGQAPFVGGPDWAYAPFFHSGLNRCYSRDPNLNNFNTDLCNHTQGLDANRRRICRCQ